MKKLFAGISIFVVAVVLWFCITIDDRVKNHIEETATYLAGVPVTIQLVEISLLDGAAEIIGLVVKNPAGYSESNAFEMDSIRGELNVGAVFTQPLIFTSLVLNSPVVHLEFKEDYQSNLQTIINVSNKQNKVQENGKISNTDQGVKTGSGSEDNGNAIDQSNLDANAQQTEDDDFKMVFRQLDIVNITLNAQRGIDQWTEAVPDIRLQDLGQEKGIGTRELGITIVRMLASKALAQAARRSLSEVVEEKVKEFGRKLLESLLKD